MTAIVITRLVKGSAPSFSVTQTTTECKTVAGLRAAAEDEVSRNTLHTVKSQWLANDNGLTTSGLFLEIVSEDGSEFIAVIV